MNLKKKDDSSMKLSPQFGEKSQYFYPKLHRHDEIQLTWIQKGEGTLVVNHDVFAFHPNQIFCIGANQPHVFKSSPAYFSPNCKHKILARTIFFNPNGKLKSLFELVQSVMNVEYCL